MFHGGYALARRRGAGLQKPLDGSKSSMAWLNRRGVVLRRFLHRRWQYGRQGE
jgi:hypothetical protein